MANCTVCGKEIGFWQGDEHRRCRECIKLGRWPTDHPNRPENYELIESQREQVNAEVGAIMLTTETAPDLPIKERLGIVTAEYVVGMHLFRDLAGVFRDVFGGRSETMQRGLKEARETALEELRKEAYALGANAVVAIDLDYSEISGGGKSMLFLVASGTAVRIEASNAPGK